MAAGRNGKASKGVKKRARNATASGPQILVLKGELGIREAAGLKRRLAMILAADGPINIDAAGVENADTATLQLLTAFVNSARNQSRLPTWQHTSKALQEAAALLGLVQHLSLYPVMSGDQINEPYDSVHPNL